MKGGWISIPDAPVHARLWDAQAGRLVPASIVQITSADEFQEVADVWNVAKSRARMAIEQRGESIPEHDAWDWKEKATAARGDLYWFAGVATDAVQGMIMLALARQASRRAGHRSESVLYVEYLESAPWNLREYVGSSVRYGGVGTALLAAAVEISVLEGCNGRLALHSLPAASSFYEKVGFERVEFDEQEKLAWFELSGVDVERETQDGSA